MNRKYLNDIGSQGSCMDTNESDNRRQEWEKERELYGVDERDTWSLDMTMIELLYERLMFFNEHVETSGIVEQYINILLPKCKEVIRQQSTFKNCELQKEIWDLWGKISPDMWW